MRFTIDETMKGHHYFEHETTLSKPRPMRFDVIWGPRDIVNFFNPSSDDFLVSNLEGTVTIDGLCDRAYCKGQFYLRYFKDATIIYDFVFEANGVEYRYVGKKANIKPWNLAVSHTTCFGTVKERDTGRLVSTSVTFFSLWDIFKFLRSFRVK